MKIDDKRVAHLKNLGKNREAAIRRLKQKMKKGLDFLEAAEIEFSHKTRDGGLLHKELAYVAGICGSVPAKGASDYRDEVYHLVYFQEMARLQDSTWQPEGTIYSNSLEAITDYRPLRRNED